jgi:hypothetical protein
LVFQFEMARTKQTARKSKRPKRPIPWTQLSEKTLFDSSFISNNAESVFQFEIPNQKNVKKTEDASEITEIEHLQNIK